jgi:hypothetical protein
MLHNRILGPDSVQGPHTPDVRHDHEFAGLVIIFLLILLRDLC